MLIIFFSFFWGYNEGIWFFIVPDVILSYAALLGFKKAIGCTLAALLGSIAAASTLYFVFSNIPEFLILKIEELWSFFPGYYPKMLTLSSQHLTHKGAQGLLTGPTSGIPYRFYVLNAYMQNISLNELLLWTPLARLQRIILAPSVVLGVLFINSKLQNRYPSIIQFLFKEENFKKTLFALITIYWILLYQWYWGVFLPSHYT